MPVVDFELNAVIDPLNHFQDAQRLNLPRQSQEEVYETTYAINVWRDAIEREFGSFSRLRHRYGGDDPPDFELPCGNNVVPLEHTRLQPEPLGWAEGLRDNVIAPDQSTHDPPITAPPSTRSDMIDSMLINPQPQNVSDFWAVIRDRLREIVREKSSHLSRPGILLVIDRFSIVENDHRRIFAIADKLIREECVSDHTILLLCIDGPNRFYSARFHCDEPSLERRR